MLSESPEVRSTSFLTPRNSCFSLCWRIFIPSALRRQNALQENAALLPAGRAAAAILAACRWLSEAKAFVFIENDAEFLLHRLPEEVKTAHYHDDETHIRTLLEAGGLQPKGGMALAAATVRGLILTVSHQGQIGALYPQVLETLVRGACRELFA